MLEIILGWPLSPIRADDVVHCQHLQAKVVLQVSRILKKLRIDRHEGRAGTV